MISYRIVELLILSERSKERLRTIYESDLGDRTLLQGRRDGVLPQHGLIDGDRYDFHGKGCRVETTHGELLDFDLKSGDVPVFDKWRFELYLESKGYNTLDPGLDVTIQQLVKRGVLTEGPPEWYSIGPALR